MLSDTGKKDIIYTMGGLYIETVVLAGKIEHYQVRKANSRTCYVLNEDFSVSQKRNWGLTYQPIEKCKSIEEFTLEEDSVGSDCFSCRNERGNSYDYCRNDLCDKYFVNADFKSVINVLPIIRKNNSLYYKFSDHSLKENIHEIKEITLAGSTIELFSEFFK